VGRFVGGKSRPFLVVKGDALESVAGRRSGIAAVMWEFIVPRRAGYG
jgi:hypothetical protein